MTIFVILDNLLWFTEVKVVDAFEKATLKKKSYEFRLVAAVCSMIQIFLTVSKQQDAIEKLVSYCRSWEVSILTLRTNPEVGKCWFP